MQQAKRWLEQPAAPFVVSAVVAFLLCIPSLWIGLIGDDYAHRRFVLAHLQGSESYGDWWNMFDGRGSLASHVFVGLQPWWASSHLSIAFLRPLGTLSHYLDYQFWPNCPALMHAHNIALYALIALVVTDLYRKLVGPGATLWLAIALYCSDDANLAGAAWIASRNTLLTALFSLLTLWLFDRSRRGRSVAASWLAPVALTCAHASSEGAVAIWGFLAAYALFIDEEPARSRLVALAPLATISVTWAIGSSLLGYGAHGSGAYLDPRVDPLLFLKSAATRLPYLLWIQFGLSDEVGSQLPRAVMRPGQALVAVSWLPVIVLGLGSALRRQSGRFFLTGCLVALLPLCAVGSIARLLFIAGFGAHGFSAELVGACMRRCRAELGPRRSVLAMLTGLPLAAHAMVAALAVPLAPRFWSDIHQNVYRAMKTLPAGPNTTDLTVMVLNTTDFMLSSFVAMYRIDLGMPAPPVMHVIGVSERPVTVTRVAENEIELAPEGGYLADATSILVRRRGEAFLRGQTIPLHRAIVRVEDITPDGRPRRIRIGTSRADASKLLWTVWDPGAQRYLPLVLPALGESATLNPHS